MPSVELPTAAEQRWHRFRQSEHRITEALERALEGVHGLMLSEYCALAALEYSDDGGHLRQQVLADAIPLNQSSVSRLVARLEKKGFTERYLCSADRRGVYTQITDLGRANLHEARPTYVRVLTEQLGALEPDVSVDALLVGGQGESSGV